LKTTSIALTIILLTISGFVSAQNQEGTAPTYDYTYTDSTGTNENASENDSTENTAENAAIPYKRIVLNIDSNTNLISYNGIVEQEESSSDSLYLRAKKFAEKLFGKEKNVFEMQKYGQKLIVNGSINAFSYSNKYNKKSIGKYEFRMIVYIKEGRYKYSITNLVHQLPTPSSGKPVRNYFEFYLNSTSNVKAYDTILRYADREIKSTIKNFETAMKEPKFVDEDEW
jgi:hypothetical protein